MFLKQVFCHWKTQEVSYYNPTNLNIPIGLSPIVHNSEYISPESFSPSLFAFQTHHTVSNNIHQIYRGDQLVNNNTKKCERAGEERRGRGRKLKESIIQLPLVLLSHSGYMRRNHLSSHHDLTIDQGRACIQI